MRRRCRSVSRAIAGPGTGNQAIHFNANWFSVYCLLKPSADLNKSPDRVLVRRWRSGFALSRARTLRNIGCLVLQVDIARRGAVAPVYRSALHKRWPCGGAALRWCTLPQPRFSRCVEEHHAGGVEDDFDFGACRDGVIAFAFDHHRLAGGRVEIFVSHAAELFGNVDLDR